LVQDLNKHIETVYKDADNVSDADFDFKYNPQYQYNLSSINYSGTTAVVSGKTAQTPSPEVITTEVPAATKKKIIIKQKSKA